MHKLRRFYYENKLKIWSISLLILFLIIILQVANYIAGQNNKKNNNLSNNLIENNTTNTISNSNKNTSVTTEKSAVTGGIVQKEELQIVNDIIEKFISFCNNKNIEEAYNLLSEECKEAKFKDVETFKKIYYNENFSGNTKKTATIENWVSNIYIVDISDDILATGKISDLKTRDYMTIVNQNGEYKLNIHNFIEKEMINKEQTVDNITFKIISKNIYIDYEEYTIQVKNGSDNTILLDSMQSTKSIYLEDINSVKYYCYTNEIISEFLKVNKGASTQLKIRFMKSFSSSAKRTSLVFSDIILNYTGSIDNSTSRQQIALDT